MNDGMRAEKERKAMEKWARTRKMGQLRFSIFYGAICYGIPTGLLTGLIDKLFSDLNSKESLDLLLQLMIYTPVSCLVGLFWGVILWKWSESRYKSYIIKKDGAR